MGAGLGVCTPAQFAAETADLAPRPGLSQQLQDRRIHGSEPARRRTFDQLRTARQRLHLSGRARQQSEPTPGAENPFDTLIAFYLVARAPQNGILVKAAGKLVPDLQTGQLTAVFEGMPQIPYTNLNIHFREGQRAPLATPPPAAPTSPRSNSPPGSPPIQRSCTRTSSSRSPTASAAGPARPAAGVLHPGAENGSLNSNAGSYSPFYLHMTRSDTEAGDHLLLDQTAPGLLGKIAGIPYCPEADIDAAKRETGTASRTPLLPGGLRSRPHRRRLRPRPVLAYAPGKLYLAGPYHGSAISIVAIDSAKVGPFDLGVVISARRSRSTPKPPKSRRLDRLGPDPPHRRRHPPPPARHPHLHGPPRIHAQPDQLRTEPRRPPPCSAPAPASPTPMKSTTSVDRPLPGRELLGAGLRPQAHPEADRPHQAGRHPGPARRPHRAPRRRQHRPAPRSSCPAPSSSNRPTSSPPAQERLRSPRLPGRLDLRRRQGVTPRSLENRSKARSTWVRAAATSSPTWSSPCTARRPQDRSGRPRRRRSTAACATPSQHAPRRPGLRFRTHPLAAATKACWSTRPTSAPPLASPRRLRRPEQHRLCADDRPCQSVRLPQQKHKSHRKHRSTTAKGAANEVPRRSLLAPPLLALLFLALPAGALAATLSHPPREDDQRRLRRRLRGRLR